MTAETESNYRNFLKAAFAERCSRNPAYSLRAFARDLDIAPSRLSEILNRRRGLSLPVALNLAKRLSLNPEERTRFIALVTIEHGRSRTARREASRMLEAHSPGLDAAQAREAHLLSVDLFRTISDWYHQALLELTYVQGFQSDLDWISKRLGISRVETELAVERLKKLGQLEDRDGKLVASHEHTSVPGGIPSEAVKGFHRQILAKAESALSFQSLDQREFGATVVSIRADMIDEAKEKLREFRREFSRYLDSAPKKDRVYCLSMQFFGLDREPTQKKTASKRGKTIGESK